MQSLSSATPEGQPAILQNELYWQSIAAMETNSSNSLQFDSHRPLVRDQWHLINSGQEVGNPDFQAIFGVPGEDINVAPVWNKGFTGDGVVVAVIDTASKPIIPTWQTIFTQHFNSMHSMAAPMQHRRPTVDPVPITRFVANAHGTAVAGLIGAIADNGIGGTGVAPGVDLCRSD